MLCEKCKAEIEEKRHCVICGKEINKEDGICLGEWGRGFYRDSFEFPAENGNLIAQVEINISSVLADDANIVCVDCAKKDINVLCGIIDEIVKKFLCKLDQEVRWQEKKRRTITLGELIKQCDALLPKHKDKLVWYEVDGTYPEGVDSWRCDYEQLAIGIGIGENKTTLSRFTAMLKDAIGFKFCGYKGGEYVMGSHSEVWVDNYGECTGTSVKGLKLIGDNILVIAV